MTSAPQHPGPRTRAFVRWAVRHGRLLWTLAAVLSLPAAWRAAQLYAHLKSDLEELLPRESASVRAIDELRTRMPGLQYLGVIVDVGDPKNLPAAERLIDDLAARVRAYPPEMVRRVRTGIGEEKAFLEKHAAVYADLADLRTIRARVEARRDWEATRAMGADLGDDEPPPSVDFSDLEAKHRKDGDRYARFDGDRFSSAKKGLTLMLIEVGSFSTGAASGGALFDRVSADLAALGGPDRYAPGMRVGWTGDVAINVEELSALVADLTLSSVLVLLAVLGVIVAFYRWWRSVPALLLPLLFGTLASFAIVTLPPFSIDSLNSNTAFLGSVIVGNGINFGIVLLARYVEERRRGAPVEEALVTGVWGTRVGTIMASAAAATAYGSLVLTQFRGFRQFGVIGGVGMLVCWASAFVLTPSLLTWLDRDESTRPRPRAEGEGPMARVAAFVERRFVGVVVAATAVTIGALVVARQIGPDNIESDFSKLRRSDTHVRGEGYWGARMDDLLGQYLTPMVVLCDGADQAIAAGDKLRELVSRPPHDGQFDEVRTIADVLPRDQEPKLAEARAIKRLLTPKIRSLIPADRRELVERVTADDALRPVGAPDLPAAFTAGMREHDGRLDRAVLLFPRPSGSTWQAATIFSIATDLRAALATVPGPDGRTPRLAGTAPLTADILSSMDHDGPIATMAALGGVVLLVVAIFRARAATPLVVGSLLVGVLWLAAATVLLRIKINFANFIAFPITFGIGVDYAVNVMARYVQGGEGDVTAAIRSTGGAVGLCSATTIIGYSSLLLAQNNGLFLFGVVAVLGEVACLTTAVVVLPAVLLLARRRPQTAAGTELP